MICVHNWSHACLKFASRNYGTVVASECSDSRTVDISSYTDRRGTSCLHGKWDKFGNYRVTDVTLWSRPGARLMPRFKLGRNRHGYIIDDERVTMQPFMLSNCIAWQTYARTQARTCNVQVFARRYSYTCYRIRYIAVFTILINTIVRLTFVIQLM